MFRVIGVKLIAGNTVFFLNSNLYDVLGDIDQIDRFRFTVCKNSKVGYLALGAKSDCLFLPEIGGENKIDYRRRVTNEAIIRAIQEFKLGDSISMVVEKYMLFSDKK